MGTPCMFRVLLVWTSCFGHMLQITFWGERRGISATAAAVLVHVRLSSRMVCTVATMGNAFEFYTVAYTDGEAEAAMHEKD